MSVLSGVDMEQEHCIIEHNNGDVTLVPLGMAACTVNGIVVSDPVKLNQGMCASFQSSLFKLFGKSGCIVVANFYALPLGLIRRFS